MGYCGPRGIPYSVFLEWERLDQDAALAWHARDLATCRCGQVPAEWREYDDHGHPVLDPETGAHLEAKVKPFTVGGEFCPACAAIAEAGKGPHADNPGWKLVLKPNPEYREPPEQIGEPRVPPDAEDGDPGGAVGS